MERRRIYLPGLAGLVLLVVLILSYLIRTEVGVIACLVSALTGFWAGWIVARRSP